MNKQINQTRSNTVFNLDQIVFFWLNPDLGPDIGPALGIGPGLSPGLGPCLGPSLSQVQVWSRFN